ncbi:MAG TPA: hypothetical protein VG711_12335 [Phycisphaerales bacterium]|nr:hypothetical protein [Phycisphaerales bacterium]
MQSTTKAKPEKYDEHGLASGTHITRECIRIFSTYGRTDLKGGYQLFLPLSATRILDSHPAYLAGHTRNPDTRLSFAESRCLPMSKSTSLPLPQQGVEATAQDESRNKLKYLK